MRFQGEAAARALRLVDTTEVILGLTVAAQAYGLNSPFAAELIGVAAMAESGEIGEVIVEGPAVAIVLGGLKRVAGEAWNVDRFQAQAMLREAA